MTQSIHGHEVMEMMIQQSGKTWTTENLEQAILDKFGAEARFHTCSAQEMTAPELIALLKKKGKFIGDDDSFVTDSNKICNH